MKTAILAMVLTIVQTPAPIPRQTADNQPSQASKHHRKASSRHKDAAPRAASMPAKTPQPDNPATPSNAEEPIRVRELPSVTVNTDRWTKAYVVFTGLLLIVGAIGVKYAVRTLRAIESQAGIMRGQLRTMGEQVEEMRSAGQQTNKLIEQAGKQVEQLTIAAEAARNSADAAIKNAQAAKESADAVVSGERSWVLVK